MKLRKQCILLVLVFALIAGAALPARAADVTTDSAASAQWLRAQRPQPAVGDETLVLALLRGSFITNIDEYTQIYLQSLSAHLQAGGAAAQPRANSARQGLVLAAAGIDIAAEAPGLLTSLEDTNAIIAEGHDALCQSLLLFGHAGVAPPKGLDVQALVNALISTRNEDNGYGSGGESNGLATSEALQALTGHAERENAEDALLNARFWLQLNSNYLGGYDINGAPSPEATAAAMVAAACDGQDPSFISMNSASMLDALLVFFDPQQGSFAPNPDSAPDVETNAQCLLALSAQQRFNRSKTPVYDFSDAVPGSIKPGSPAENPQSGNSSQNNTSSKQEQPATGPLGLLFGLSLPVLIAIAGGGVAATVLIAALATRSRRKKKRRPKTAPPHPAVKAGQGSKAQPYSAGRTSSASPSEPAKPNSAKKAGSKKDKKGKNGKFTYRM